MRSSAALDQVELLDSNGTLVQQWTAVDASAAPSFAATVSLTQTGVPMLEFSLRVFVSSFFLMFVENAYACAVFTQLIICQPRFRRVMKL